MFSFYITSFFIFLVAKCTYLSSHKGSRLTYLDIDHRADKVVIHNHLKIADEKDFWYDILIKFCSVKKTRDRSQCPIKVRFEPEDLGSVRVRALICWVRSGLSANMIHIYIQYTPCKFHAYNFGFLFRKKMQLRLTEIFFVEISDEIFLLKETFLKTV